MATKKWLEENSEYITEYHRQYNLTHKERKKVYKRKIWDWFKQYKSQKKCEFCDENHSSCLDFHHKDPKEKCFNITEAVRSGRSVKKIEKEIQKCIVLCANCHRKLHWPEQEVSSIAIVFGESKPKRIRKNCKFCGEIIKSAKSTMCKKCYSIHRKQKVERPTKEELEKMLWQKPTTHIAKQLGISDKAVEKWARYYGISKPPRGHWSKVKHST